MANIAQTINVLQAMLLTKDDQLVKTPTYYVFKMYKVHQNATLLPLKIKCENYTFESTSLPSISASASKDDNGKIHISLANIDPNEAAQVEINLNGSTQTSTVSGNIITSENMNDFNDFGKEEKVNLSSFNNYEITDNMLKVSLPSKSVVTLEID